jgi:hypothetical protein
VMMNHRSLQMRKMRATTKKTKLLRKLEKGK